MFPQRDRIGFDEVLSHEEGRGALGAVDDYEYFLADRGYAGRQFDHGLSNNEYSTRPWHSPEDCHPTNWVAQTMARQIRRKDPSRPAFWYLSFSHPHPPSAPLSDYLGMYEAADLVGDNSPDDQGSEDPYALRVNRRFRGVMSARDTGRARRAFYALCTHIDHQLRVVIGTLREEGHAFKHHHRNHFRSWRYARS